MTHDEIKEAIKEGVLEALARPDLHCRYRIPPEEHDREHEAVKRFVTFTNRLESMKWGALQKIVVFVIVGLFSLMVYGAAMKLRILGGLGWLGR